MNRRAFLVAACVAPFAPRVPVQATAPLIAGNTFLDCTAETWSAASCRTFTSQYFAYGVMTVSECRDMEAMYGTRL